MSKKKQPQKKQKTKEQEVSILDSTILYDNILVKPIVFESDNGLAKPQQYDDKPEWGKVLAQGEGRIFDNGVVVPLKVKTGDLVLFQKYSAQKFRLNGEDYLIIKEEDIYCISNK